MKNRETPVFINLTSRATYEGGNVYPVQFITSGVLSRPEREHYVIRYRESQEDESTGEIVDSDIELDLSRDRVIMTRQGDFSSMMVFSRDRRFEGRYTTPYGDMEMAVFTRRLKCDLGEKEGSVHLEYQLHLQGSYASTNELHLAYQAGSVAPGATDAH